MHRWPRMFEFHGSHFHSWYWHNVKWIKHVNNQLDRVQCPGLWWSFLREPGPSNFFQSWMGYFGGGMLNFSMNLFLIDLSCFCLNVTVQKSKITGVCTVLDHGREGIELQCLRWVSLDSSDNQGFDKATWSTCQLQKPFWFLPSYRTLGCSSQSFPIAMHLIGYIVIHAVCLWVFYVTN